MAVNLLKNSDFRQNSLRSEETTKFTNRGASKWSTYNAGLTNPLTLYHTYVDISTFDVPVVVFNESDGTRNWKAINQTIENDALKESLPNGPTTLYLSFDVQCTLAGANLRVGLHYRKVGESANSFYSGDATFSSDSLTESVGEWKRYSIELPYNWDTQSNPIIIIYGYNFSSNAILYMKNVKLEVAEKATEWTPNPLDFMNSANLPYTYTPNVLAKHQLTLTKVLERAVTNTYAEYALSTSSTNQNGTWGTSVPAWQDGRYYWQRIVTTYSDGTSETGTAVCLTGSKGNTGASVGEIQTEFYLSTSKTNQTGGEWSTTPPTWEINKYLWTRAKITYVNPSSITYTTPVCDSTWESIVDVENAMMFHLSELDSALRKEIVDTNEQLKMSFIKEYFDPDDEDGIISKQEVLAQKVTALEATVNGIELNFSQGINAESEKNQELQGILAEYQRYIRFIDGHIYLGTNENPIELVIKNDRLSFMQAGTEVAFFADNNFYVTNGVFSETLQLGNFVFAPRPDGSLDFKKKS